MKLYAGFDGGGSKTACFLADDNGRLLGQGLGGPSNYLFCGRDTAARSLKDALAGAFAAAGLEPRPLTGVFVASAAVLLGHGDAHLPFFREHIQAARLACDSDILPVWFGGTGTQPAVVAIAGTGSLAYGCTGEGFFRVGGWGPLLGDEGSGYDLGRQALRQAARMADGRDPLDREFLQELLRFYQIEDPHRLISAVNGPDSRETIAACAKAVAALDGRGNPTAARLLDRCADELALLISTAAKKAGFDALPAVVAGGLALPLLPRLQKRLAHVQVLSVEPGLAAAALALHRDSLQEAAQALLKAGAPC